MRADFVRHQALMPASKEKVRGQSPHAVTTAMRQALDIHYARTAHEHKRLAHMKNYTLGIKSLTLASHSLRLHGCVGLGALPDGKAECDLVDKVGQVVDQIQGCIVRVIEDQIAEEVACWVD